MNITEFKNNVLKLNLNSAEIKRINNLSASSFKYNAYHFCNISSKKITIDNFKQIWNKLNKQLAKEDKFHRMQTHSMRNRRTVFIDYSNAAYNNHTDDL